jgi:hypothetical protein
MRERGQGVREYALAIALFVLVALLAGIVMAIFSNEGGRILSTVGDSV